MTRDDGNPNTDIDLGWTALLTAPYRSTRQGTCASTAWSCGC
jgi:hypothetical protein